jgi:hypothetical protein
MFASRWSNARSSFPLSQGGAPGVAEVLKCVRSQTEAGWPEGMRVLVRRERPHPGAQLTLLEAHDGWRYQCIATDTGRGQLAFLEARHRAHARVEDWVKAIKQTGMGRFPSREFGINPSHRHSSRPYLNFGRLDTVDRVLISGLSRHLNGGPT